MAEAVFFVHAEFGHGLAQPGKEKDGVVAKAACAAFFWDDFTFTETIRNVDLVILCGDGDGRMESSCPGAGFAS